MPTDPTEIYLQDVMAHQRGVYAYILSLVHDLSSADDILQEVNLVLWRRRGDFTPGTNFKAWAFRIARMQVMAHRKKFARDRLRFDDELIGRLAGEAEQRADAAESRRRALADCLEKLGDEDRDLVRHRYAGDESVGAMAERVGRSANAIYQALFRVRAALLGCIEKAVAGEGA